MATYRFKKRGGGMPNQFANFAPFMAHIDIPDLILNGGLTNTSDVDTALASTGFVASDVLQVFKVPAGFWLANVGVRVTTAEGATCTADIGNASATQTHRLAVNADGFMGTCDLNSATTQITLIADEDIGGSTYQGCVFITEGTIDLTFGHSDTDACIFDIWAIGWKVW